MAKRAMPELWIIRVARGHKRLWVGRRGGLAVYALLPGEWRRVTRMLMAWDIAVAAYLICDLRR